MLQQKKTPERTWRLKKYHVSTLWKGTLFFLPVQCKCIMKLHMVMRGQIKGWQFF